MEIHEGMKVEGEEGSPARASRSGDDGDSADVTEHSEALDFDQSKTNGDTSKSLNDRKAANAKDPSRPRRKKARRACFACQRAHLTCGMHHDRLCAGALIHCEILY